MGVLDLARYSSFNFCYNKGNNLSDRMIDCSNFGTHPHSSEVRGTVRVALPDPLGGNCTMKGPNGRNDSSPESPLSAGTWAYTVHLYGWTPHGVVYHRYRRASPSVAFAASNVSATPSELLIGVDCQTPSFVRTSKPRWFRISRGHGGLASSRR
jgi:hypothetical protein